MRVPLSWLKEFVPTKLSAVEIAERLTMAGVEVEDIVDYAKRFEKVVVGEIVHIRPHPNADKLRLAFVEMKKGTSPIEVVCGAPNIAVGQKVAFARVGARLADGTVLQERSIRSVVSHGMICAEDELGLGTMHEGTMVLDPRIATGTPFARAIGQDDVVLDIAAPTNRGDLLSVRGIAWELAALTGTRFIDRTPRARKKFSPSPRAVRVKIASLKLCPRYTARVVSGIAVAPSPDWMQRRLRLAGVRPINAVVDGTNYVMLEYGQPLHAFDAEKLRGDTITVRTAVPGERTTTLDGVVRTLDRSMLVIADAEGPIALAGVMGSARAEVSSSTTDIVLESAVFDPVVTRKTSRGLGLSSEASKRFEKGIPHELPVQASHAAAALIAELCGGTAVGPLVTAGKRSHPTRIITISPPSFSDILGEPVAPGASRKALTRLGFEVKGSAKSWKVRAPFWRLDVSVPADLIDEVGRTLGYNRLPEVLPNMEFVPRPLPRLVTLKQDLQDLLVGFGFSETITHAYYGLAWKQEVGDPHFEIENPLDKTQEYLRRSIVPDLRRAVLRAVDAGEDARVFQIGRVFVPKGEQSIENQQPWKLAIGMAFKAPPGYCRGRKLNGVLDELFDALGIIAAGETRHPVSTSFVKGRTIEWTEVDIATMRDNFAPKPFMSLPKYPAVYRDVSFWAPATLSYRSVSEAVKKAGSPLLAEVELFDVYEKEKKRSFALHLTFRSSEKTLTEREILANMKAISDALVALGAEIR